MVEGISLQNSMSILAKVARNFERFVAKLQNEELMLMSRPYFDCCLSDWFSRSFGQAKELDLQDLQSSYCCYLYTFSFEKEEFSQSLGIFVAIHVVFVVKENVKKQLLLHQHFDLNDPIYPSFSYSSVSSSQAPSLSSPFELGKANDLSSLFFGQ
jgi:hypothetical protein